MCAWGLVAVIVVAAIITLSLVYLPWWGTLLVLLGLLIVLAMSFKWIATKMLERGAMALFDMKSKVLRGAQAQVHGVKAAQPPERAENADDDDDDDDEAETMDLGKDGGSVTIPITREYYAVEVTITPMPVSGKTLGMWDVDDLLMVPYDMKVTRSPDSEPDDETCNIEQVRIHHEGTYQELDGPKLQGPQRLEFLIGVKPGVKNKRLKFRYYFEAFGEIQLP